MRGRNGQGSDRTGRAHPLTLLRVDKVPTNKLTALVRGSLLELKPQLFTILVSLHFLLLIVFHVITFLMALVAYLAGRMRIASANSPSKSSAPSRRFSRTGPRRLSTIGRLGVLPRILTKLLGVKLLPCGRSSFLEFYWGIVGSAIADGIYQFVVVISWVIAGSAAADAIFQVVFIIFWVHHFFILRGWKAWEQIDLKTCILFTFGLGAPWSRPSRS